MLSFKGAKKVQCGSKLYFLDRCCERSHLQKRGAMKCDRLGFSVCIEKLLKIILFLSAAFSVLPVTQPHGNVGHGSMGGTFAGVCKSWEARLSGVYLTIRGHIGRGCIKPCFDTKGSHAYR